MHSDSCSSKAFSEWVSWHPFFALPQLNFKPGELNHFSVILQYSFEIGSPQEHLYRSNSTKSSVITLQSWHIWWSFRHRYHCRLPGLAWFWHIWQTKSLRKSSRSEAIFTILIFEKSKLTHCRWWAYSLQLETESWEIEKLRIERCCYLAYLVTCCRCCYAYATTQSSHWTQLHYDYAAAQSTAVHLFCKHMVVAVGNTIWVIFLNSRNLEQNVRNTRNKLSIEENSLVVNLAFRVSIKVGAYR